MCFACLPFFPFVPKKVSNETIDGNIMYVFAARYLFVKMRKFTE